MIYLPPHVLPDGIENPYPEYDGESITFNEFIDEWTTGIGQGIDYLDKIATWTAEAVEGAVDILSMITDYIPSYGFFVQLFPSPVGSILTSIFAVTSTILAFKVVGYFT